MRFQDMAFEAQFGELRSRLDGAPSAERLASVYACVHGMALRHRERVEGEVVSYVREALARWPEPALPEVGAWHGHLGWCVAQEVLRRGLEQGAAWLPLVRAATLEGQASHEVAARLAASDAMTGLVRLDLARSHVGPLGLADLMRASWVTGLEALDLRERAVRDALAGWRDRPMERLVWLNLERARDVGVDSLRGVASGAPALRSLALSWRYVPGEDAWLFEDAVWPGLETLKLGWAASHARRDAPLVPWPLDRLLSGPRGGTLRSLQVQHVGLSARGVKIAGGQALETLSFEPSVDVCESLRDAALGSLHTLHMTEPHFAASDGSWAELVASLPSLKHLRLTARGPLPGMAEALPAGLETLQLDLETSSRLIDGLIARPLERLRELWIPSDRFGEAARERARGTWLARVVR